MMENFLLFNCALDDKFLYNKFSASAAKLNYGAFVCFSGIIRKEDNINGLSFDIYEPLLKEWFNEWCKKVENMNVKLFFAHSIGDVLIGQSSYFAAIASSHRKNALELFPNFIEDFKKNAPIWKYDLINNERIYAKDRSFMLKNAGILS